MCMYVFAPPFSREAINSLYGIVTSIYVHVCKLCFYSDYVCNYVWHMMSYNFDTLGHLQWLHTLAMGLH